ncbi:TPA: hypothetical protein ENS27_13310 [bacterium]|nr:hypothetical protein [bacterium]
MSDKHLVAICDILGFKNLIMNNSVEDVANNSLGYLKRSLYHSITQEDIPDNLPTMTELKQNSKVGFAIFSDTILLYTKKDTDDDCQFLLETCGWLLFENVFNHSTRLRIGISYGETFINEEDNIYIGKSIVEAYQLEKSQEWAGGALTKNAEERIPEFVKTEFLYDKNTINGRIFNWYLTYYDVPLKGGFSERLLTIDWTRGIHHYLPFEWSKNHKEPTEDEIFKKPDIVSKWRNTKKYHEDNCYYCSKIK